MSEIDLKFLNTRSNSFVGEVGPDTIAVRHRPGDGRQPCIVWLGGFRSDMTSTKAEAIDRWAAESGHGFLRFDYSGHGRSGGEFRNGTIGRWFADSMAALRLVEQQRLVLVGSSMGGWIALLVARALAEARQDGRLAGMVLIAPAVDFTERLMWAEMSPEIRQTIEHDGEWLRQSDYSPEPIPITRALIEDGRKHLLLDGEIRTRCPVHILQGMKDPDVPWGHSMLLVEHLVSDPVSVTLVKDGDHRLSGEEDLKRLLGAIAAIG